jgi:hypothetical protein
MLYAVYCTYPTIAVTTAHTTAHHHGQTRHHGDDVSVEVHHCEHVLIGVELLRELVRLKAEPEDCYGGPEEREDEPLDGALGVGAVGQDRERERGGGEERRRGIGEERRRGIGEESGARIGEGVGEGRRRGIGEERRRGIGEERGGRIGKGVGEERMGEG